jgi:hypothetical protein
MSFSVTDSICKHEIEVNISNNLWQFISFFSFPLLRCQDSNPRSWHNESSVLPLRYRAGRPDWAIFQIGLLLKARYDFLKR